MKKTYESVKFDIIEFSSDIITASGGNAPDVAGFGFDLSGKLMTVVVGHVHEEGLGAAGNSAADAAMPCPTIAGTAMVAAMIARSCWIAKTISWENFGLSSIL